MSVGSLQERLRGERDWCDTLQREAATLRTTSLTPEHAPLALELAAGLELIEPDRNRAIEMYLVAWRSGRVLAALERARALCMEIGDLQSAAKIARLEYQHRPDPMLLRDEGIALLDAERVDQAVRPLLEAARLCPGDPTIETALAVARGEWPNPRAEIERLVAEARAAGATPRAATFFLQAARIVRIQGGDPQIYGRLLKAAFDCGPREDHIYGLLENFLVQRGDGDELLALYRQRIEHAPGLSARFDDLRRAGVRLVLRNVQPGLGLRLLDRALREAYQHAMASIPGQLACIELLRRHAFSSNLLPRFVGLLSEALAAPQDDLSIVWLAAVGVDVSWRALGQADVARGYAGRLAALAPAHPALLEYLAGGGLADVAGGGGDDDLVYLDGSGWNTPAAAPAALPTLAPSEPIAMPAAVAAPVRAPIAAPAPVEDDLLTLLPEPELAAPQPPAAWAAAPPPSNGIELDFGADAGEAPELGELPADVAVGVADLSVAYAPPAIDAGEIAPSEIELDVGRPSVAASAEVAGEVQFHEEAIDQPLALDDEDVELDEPVDDLELDEPDGARPPFAKAPEPPPAPRALGRVALVARPAHLARPGSLIPRGALDALNQAAHGRAAVPAAPPIPLEATGRATRLEMPVDLVLTPVEGKPFPPTSMVTRDLSSTGAFVVSDITLKVGDTVSVEIRLPTSTALEEQRHSVRARVVRRIDNGYGLVFVDPGAPLIAAIHALVVVDGG